MDLVINSLDWKMTNPWNVTVMSLIVIDSVMDNAFIAEPMTTNLLPL